MAAKKRDGSNPDLVTFEWMVNSIYSKLVRARIREIEDEFGVGEGDTSSVGAQRVGIEAAYHGSAHERAKVLSSLFAELARQEEIAQAHAAFVNAVWDAFLSFELDDHEDPKKQRMSFMRFLEEFSESSLIDT